MGPSPPNYLHNRTCKKFKSGEILSRECEPSSGTFLRHNQYYNMCMCVNYCKNQISAEKISSKTRSRRREIEFPSSRNPKFSRWSKPPNHPRWFVALPLNVRPPPPPTTFASGYVPACLFLIGRML